MDELESFRREIHQVVPPIETLQRLFWDNTIDLGNPNTVLDLKRALLMAIINHGIKDQLESCGLTGCAETPPVTTCSNVVENAPEQPIRDEDLGDLDMFERAGLQDRLIALLPKSTYNICLTCQGIGNNPKCRFNGTSTEI